MKRVWLGLALLALGLMGCPPPGGNDGGNPAVDAGHKACLEMPPGETRTPNGQLPCELLPPGFEK